MVQMNEMATYERFSDAIDLLQKNEICEDEFNAIAIEYAIACHEDENNPLFEAGAPERGAWVAKAGRLFSPLMDITITSEMTFDRRIIRLSVSYTDPIHRGGHINAATADVECNLQKNVCLITHDKRLEAIVAVWDYVARRGVQQAAEDGIITNSWASNVICSCSVQRQNEGARLALFVRRREVADWCNHYDLDAQELYRLAHNDQLCDLNTPHPRFRDVFVVSRREDREWLNMRECRHPGHGWQEYYHDVEHRTLLTLTQHGPVLGEEYVRLN